MMSFEFARVCVYGVMTISANVEMLLPLLNGVDDIMCVDSLCVCVFVELIETSISCMLLHGM